MAGTMLVLSVYAVLSWSTYRAWVGHAPSWVAVTFAVLPASCTLALILFAWATIALWSRNGLERAWYLANPEVAVVSRLVLTLHLLSVDRDAALGVAGGPLRLCSLLWLQLDRAAEAAERGLPIVLSSHDPGNPEVQRLALRIGAGLRALKREIACLLSRGTPETPDGGTRVLRRTLDAWVGGGVEDLPQKDPEPALPAKRQTLLLRRVLAAIAPLIVLALVRLSPFHSVEVTGTVTTFAILWLIAALLRGLLGEEFENNLDSTTKLSAVVKAGGTRD